MVQTVESQAKTTPSTSATTQTLTASSELSTTNLITTSAIITTSTFEMTTSMRDETQTSSEERPTSTVTTFVAMCPCSCDYMDKIEYWRNETNQMRQYHELSQRLAQLKRLLSVNTKNLSSTVNKKISADDERPSASVTGYVGAAFIALVLGGIVLADVPVLIRQTCRLLKDIRKLCVRK
ncbi:uncharacterized protein LOC133180167 [Saccostrea echinata]|uniref:uncharacterized protein LOC133180167 n=1 Tax=Saccostrea echinata TaxID=191078 RepID=UPI002A808653|nr:uncharacterized protein LOC133180167 [Saccostrea echinata]